MVDFYCFLTHKNICPAPNCFFCPACIFPCFLMFCCFLIIESQVRIECALIVEHHMGMWVHSSRCVDGKHIQRLGLEAMCFSVLELIQPNWSTWLKSTTSTHPLIQLLRPVRKSKTTWWWASLVLEAAGFPRPCLWVYLDMQITAISGRKESKTTSFFKNLMHWALDAICTSVWLCNSLAHSPLVFTWWVPS